jgi:hypothetical protein
MRIVPSIGKNMTHLIRLLFLGLFITCVSEQLLPRQVLAWTTPVFVTGWYGDPNVPVGQPWNHDYPLSSSTVNFSSVGRMLGGSGLTLSHVTLGTCCTVFQMQNVSATFYATVVTNGEIPAEVDPAANNGSHLNFAAT